MKYGKLSLGQVEAIVNKLGGMEGVMKFLRGELKVVTQNGKQFIERALKHLTLKQVVTVPGYAVKCDDFVNGNLGWKLYKGHGFDKIEAELRHDMISCPMHSREVFTLTDSMYDKDIQVELNQPSYPTVEEVIASFISRINMWASDKSSSHGLLVNGYVNIEHARMSEGCIVAVYCLFGGGEWSFRCSELGGFGYWNDGNQFSCAQAL